MPTRLRFLFIVADRKMILNNGANQFIDAVQVSVISGSVEGATKKVQELIPQKTHYQLASIVEEVIK